MVDFSIPGFCSVGEVRLKAQTDFKLYNSYMKRILIDGRWIKQTGIGRYVENILAEMIRINAKSNAKYQFILLIRPEDRSAISFSLKGIEVIETNILWYTPQEQLLLPNLIDKAKPDLVHFTNFNIPLSYRKPFVVTVHDLTMLRFKNIRGGMLAPFTYSLKDIVMRHVLKTSIVRSRVVFTPSKYVKDDIMQHYRVKPEKLMVTYNAVNSTWKQAKVDLKKYSITKPFLLYVGNAYPHKNLERLLLAIELLVKDEKSEFTHQLVIVGRKDVFTKRLEKFATKHKLTKQIVFTDKVSDSELAGLYKAASLYVFPSLSEGFGLPALEAMSYNLPVLSSNASCMPEVYGKAANYFDAKDPAAIAAAIQKLLQDPARQTELKRLGQAKIKQYSWEVSAKMILKGYDRALAERPRIGFINRVVKRQSQT